MSSARAERAATGCASSFARALWGLEVSVGALPASPRDAFRRPTFAASRIWLPSSLPAGVLGSFSDYQLAATAHASAHLAFGVARFQVRTLKPVQIALVSLVEDARVEQLARLRYPGLARLWAPFHRARPSGAKTSAALLARLAHALHDEAYVDDDAWVKRGRELFRAARSNLHDATLSRHIGNVLGNDLGQMRVQFSAQEYRVEPAYRDDHAGLWQLETESIEDASALQLEGVRRTQHDAPAAQQKPQERALPARDERAGDAREAASASRLESAAGAEEVLRYEEWDYVIGRERPRFCSVRERAPQPGELGPMDAAQARYAFARRRLARSALRLANRRAQQVRRLTSGDRLDLPAVIAAVVARASGARPDPRVYRRARFQLEPPALLVLMDLSESLNRSPPGASTTLLELARSASALLASTLADATQDLAIHGFSSNGRHDVGYSRFKDFRQPYDDHVRARLAGMRAHSSTRLGTALRHAGRALAACTARRKLLLVVTDGEPADVDVHDSAYLLFDAKHATLQNRRRGSASFCVGLPGAAEASIRRIFGSGNYLLLDQLDNLPQKLSQLYLRLSI